MEPLASNSGLSLIRPIGASQANLSAALQEGRVLTAQVLERSDGGTLMLGIGGQRVPAEGGPELEAGDRFLARVERHGGQLTLRPISAGAVGDEMALLRAVRGLLGQERPLAARLGDLAAALRTELAQPAAGERADPRLAHLLARVEAQVLGSGADGESLRRLLTAGGLSYEATLAAAAAELGADNISAALRALVDQLLSMLRGLGLQTESGTQSIMTRALQAALRTLGGEPLSGALDPASLAQLGERLRAVLLANLRGAGPAGVRLAAVLESGSGWPRGNEGALLRALVQIPGALGKSALASSLGEAALAGLGRGLRGELLLHLLEEGGGALRELASRTLGSLDLEQLMNAARREFGEAQHHSVVVSDGDRWTTAELFFLRRDGGGEGGDEGDGGDGDSDGGGGQDSFHVVVGVDFSALGPIRADLLVRGKKLAVRLRVTRPDVAQRIRRAASSLAESLEVGGHEVLLSVVDARPEEVEVKRMAHDIRFLREHSMMDVSG
ncbi:MAG: hypothetical protein V3T22_07015 [Planctomycetota bacterium]